MLAAQIVRNRGKNNIFFQYSSAFLSPAGKISRDPLANEKTLMYNYNVRIWAKPTEYGGM